MTTTATASESQASRLRIPAENAFDELAFHDPTVCSRCFARIRRHERFRPDATQGVSKYAPDERYVRAFDGEKGYTTEADNSYGYRPIHTSRTFCGECGAQSGRADDLVLSRRTALVFADHLYERFEDADVAIDRHALKYTIRELKSRERLRGYDTEIFRRATRIAIEHARR